MNREDWKYVFYLLKDIYVSDKKRVFCVVIKAVTGIINPYITIVLLGQIIDAIGSGKSILDVISYIIIGMTLKLICTLIESRTQEFLAQKLDYTKDIEARNMNKKAMGLNYEFLENIEVVDLRYKAMSKSFYGIAGWCLLNVQLLIEGFLSIIVTLIVIAPLITETDSALGFIGTRWAAISLVFFIVILTLINYKSGIIYTQKAKKILDKLSNSYNKKQFYIDKFTNIEFQKDVRINNWDKLIYEDVDKLFLHIKDVEYNHGDKYVKRQIISGMVSGISNFFVYFFAGIRAYRGMISTGSMITYASSIMQFSSRMMTFAATLGNMKSVSLFAKDYYAFMTLRNKQHIGTRSLPIDEKIIFEFEHVSFKYSGESDYVLKDVSLSFSLDEKIAVVGKNGSGKTTFVKLLCRLYDVSEGCIKLNGINIKEYDIKEYLDWFSVVFQDFAILGFSVAENVAGNYIFDSEKVIKSLKKAGMDDAEKIILKKVGKDIFEDGMNFSGGEKQKIAIARAIYKETVGIILDEPTAALDPISENEIYEGIDKLVGNKGAIYISHRLSSCKFCEKIFVFDAGKFVQQGTHQELVNKDGIYRDLWIAQSQCYVFDNIK